MARAVAFVIATVAAGFPALASAEPPVTPETQVTAPMPEGGRRGPPPPRVSNRFEPTQATATANELGLVRGKDGTYSFTDPQGRFTLLITEDGTAYFADRWRKPSRKQKRRGKGVGRPPEGALAALNPFKGIPMRGPLEWIMEAKGTDIHAAAKADALERTADFRTGLTLAWQRRIIRERLTALPRQLAALWADEALSPARKREVLFERWDECADDFGAARNAPSDAIARIEVARLRAADAARAEIIEFVRRHAGEGSPLGFSSAEIERLNHRRRSASKFEPYK